MWGTILSAAAQGAGYLMDYFRGKQQQQQADAAAARQEAHYTAKANENPLSRSQNQYLLGQYDRDAQQQIENARGVAAITGATPEYGLAVQKAAANGRANLMGHMAAGASERADEYEQKAEDVRHAKEVADQERTAQQRASIATMVSNAAIPIGEFADSYLGGAKKAPAASVSGGASDTNKSKIATSTHTSGANPNFQNPYGANATGFIPNADGTYKGKDGMQYIKNPDGSYKLYFPNK